MNINIEKVLQKMGGEKSKTLVRKQAPKLAKVEGKLVKHAPPRHYSYQQVQKVIHIKSSTPFVSALKRIEKHMRQESKNLKNKNRSSLNNSYITIKGMGKAISKVLSLGLHFKTENGNKIETFTKSIGVLDEFKKSNDDSSDSDDEETTLRKRNVSCVEIRIYVK